MLTIETDRAFAVLREGKMTPEQVDTFARQKFAEHSARLHLLTPGRLIEDREKAARLGQVYNLKPAEAMFMAAGLFAFALAIYARGLI